MSFIYENILPSHNKCINFPFGAVVLNTSTIIGEGAYSIVYIARNSNNRNIKYALKKMIVHSNEMDEFINMEITALQRFKHHNIVSLLGHIDCMENNRKIVYLAFPFISNGSLRQRLDVIIANGETPIALNIILQSFLQILSASNTLHNFQPSYVHQDIKPEV